MRYYNLTRAATLLVVGATLVLTCLSTAHAERVWDKELKRYLTPEELGHEEIYLSPQEAATLMFNPVSLDRGLFL